MIRHIMNRKTIFAAMISILALVSTMTSPVWAMASRPNPDPNAPPPAWAQWVPIMVLVAVFWFILFRPQSQQRKQRETMMGNLKKGDKIVTQAGFVATIVAVGTRFLDVKLNDETRVRMLKSGVSEVLPETADAELSTLSS